MLTIQELNNEELAEATDMVKRTPPAERHLVVREVFAGMQDMRSADMTRARDWFFNLARDSVLTGTNFEQGYVGFQLNK
jgi:hypothetical protein